ncbi:MAG: MAPEG family protein [Gammaproteobacteria bacterium]|nr:MAPEG family protein [Gammaproteobacteria bacterium]
MTTAFWCVLIAALLPYLGTLSAKIGGRMPPRANSNPREWLERLSGWQKRAHWYQLNSFEVFPAFAVAVIVATLTHAPQSRVDLLAEVFIGFRLAYYVCYVAGWATLRTLVWTGGAVCTVWLFVLAA